jgi:hypothetical protein
MMITHRRRRNGFPLMPLTGQTCIEQLALWPDGESPEGTAVLEEAGLTFLVGEPDLLAGVKCSVTVGLDGGEVGEAFATHVR